MSVLADANCAICRRKFDSNEKAFTSSGKVYHEQCFICCQCLQPFPDGIFFEHEGRKYCDYDFRILFAPVCGDCGEFISGRVIKALSRNWHPQCFRCEICKTSLADSGFVKSGNRALCRKCNAEEKQRKLNMTICKECNGIIEGSDFITINGQKAHIFHFDCYVCGKPLTSHGFEKDGKTYCLRCYDKMGVPICAACKRPITDVHIVAALGKSWHADHFACAKCEKPFHGRPHYEHNGLAYCETHYNQLFGEICFYCNQAIKSDKMIRAFRKHWCEDHFRCSSCGSQLTLKSKFFELDLRPLCKKCYDRFPSKLRKHLKTRMGKSGN
ncbi:LIM and senescent cell antigen-like-containing domain protein 1 [Trichoplax sp. H2]|uniref:LIM zinc-binding domain-containing protein n=1 Tax=Trichoplax adhaerens TaxID=10228 RepID=B3RM06_TRIAD|nr:hypothetical protein TRIADDRAFT_18460 [Trichoplax adhaerens]EDV28879.1 hypothetical protein TRIADDRAFT_18460 [Trichoplax adhaerens]RDD46673.1 LIM and senescent cell antigen-like-containing domain protein 1 [Trichoplax sp. H2]|eukprot:XP_002108081.1 hypothetical protein TRIADDRAFT_18460 [Trichoplax adhaerens]